MHVIGMDQAAGDEPVVLKFLGDCGWPEDKFVDQFFISESYERNKAGNNDDVKREIGHAKVKGT
jgi:hypothetical protein